VRSQNNTLFLAQKWRKRWIRPSVIKEAMQRLRRALAGNA
jgi:hypothetical protein